MSDKTITPETVITSPRLVANGQGAWSGTVREIFNAEQQNLTGTALGNLEAALYEEGKLQGSELDRGFDVDAHAHLLTLDHLRDLLGDPNAEITG